MKLIKNDYVIEGTPKEINEFLESERKGKLSKEVVNSNVRKYIVTQDTVLFYVNKPSMFDRGYNAPEGTILEYVRNAYITNTAGTNLRAIFKDKNDVEVTVPLRDIREYKPESMKDLMGKPLEELIEMAKSEYEKGE